jgi:heme oxygenase
MGTMAKRLGQVAARSLETEGANILKTAAANKVPGSLAMALDGTLKRGHDMRVFGLGTAASMASRARYGRFTRSMHAVYATMEEELDATLDAAAPGEGVSSSPVGLVWERHGAVLRREAALLEDLTDVGLVPFARPGLLDASGSGSGSVGADHSDEGGGDWVGASSPATAAYVAAIREAGASDRRMVVGGGEAGGEGLDGGGRLLGQFYVRYFADLFGGQMLGLPTQVAVGLAPGTPRHYDFDIKDRRAFIGQVYASLNDAGALLANTDSAAPAQQDAVVEEAMKAWRGNVSVYSEETGMWVDAARGAANVAVGLARRQVFGQ